MHAPVSYTLDKRDAYTQTRFTIVLTAPGNMASKRVRDDGSDSGVDEEELGAADDVHVLPDVKGGGGDDEDDSRHFNQLPQATPFMEKSLQLQMHQTRRQQVDLLELKPDLLVTLTGVKAVDDAQQDIVAAASLYRELWSTFVRLESGTTTHQDVSRQLMDAVNYRLQSLFPLIQAGCVHRPVWISQPVCLALFMGLVKQAKLISDRMPRGYLQAALAKVFMDQYQTQVHLDLGVSEKATKDMLETIRRARTGAETDPGFQAAVRSNPTHAAQQYIASQPQPRQQQQMNALQMAALQGFVFRAPGPRPAPGPIGLVESKQD